MPRRRDEKRAKKDMFSVEIREEFGEKEGLKKPQKAAKIGYKWDWVCPKGHSRKTRIETSP